MRSETWKMEKKFVSKTIRGISWLSGRLKAQFVVTHERFPEKPIIFEIYVEFGAF